jgi:hypothetical protein
MAVLLSTGLHEGAILTGAANDGEEFEPARQMNHGSEK